MTSKYEIHLTIATNNDKVMLCRPCLGGGLSRKRGLLIRRNFLLKLLGAVLCAISMLAQSAPTCEDGFADTTYKPVASELPGYPGQLNIFKVTRVVGPGLPTEYTVPNSLTLDSSILDQYIAQGVLKMKG